MVPTKPRLGPQAQAFEEHEPGPGPHRALGESPAQPGLTRARLGRPRASSRSFTITKRKESNKGDTDESSRSRQVVPTREKVVRHTMTNAKWSPLVTKRGTRSFRSSTPSAFISFLCVSE